VPIIHASDLYSEPVIVGTTDELAAALGVNPDSSVGLNYIPRKRQLIRNITTGAEYAGDGEAAFSELEPLPGGGGDGLPIADSADTMTADAENTISSSGTYKWVKFPSDTAVLAWGVEGDDFPRAVIPSDSTDGIIYFGDGTYDPYIDGAAIWLDSDGALKLQGGSANRAVKVAHALLVGGDATFAFDVGPVIQSPDSTAYRIVVANDGTLSADVVT
jgi:hypothetical protein